MEECLTFDWGRLARLSAVDARFSADLVAAVAHPAIDEAALHAADLLKAPVEVTSIRAALAAPDADGDVVVHAFDGARTLSVSIDGRGGHAVVARLVGAAPIELTNGVVGERGRAALSALALAVLRRMGPTPAPFRLVAQPSHAPSLVVTVQALVGSEPVEIRVAWSAVASGSPRGDVALLGLVPITLSLALARPYSLTAEELAALRPSRALVLGDRALSMHALALVSPRAERGVRVALDASLSERAGAVVTGEAIATPLAMDPDSSSPLSETLREAEIVVRVELSSVTLPASSWAALRVGDVVTTDTPVGSRVLLRAGGVAFAEGELCELAGRLAVKITKRASTPEAP